jgi:hypothetical protein
VRLYPSFEENRHMPTHRPTNPSRSLPSFARPGWTSHIIDFLAAGRPQRLGFAFALGVLVALGVAACDYIVAAEDREPDAIALFPASAQVEEGDFFQLQVRDASKPGGGNLSGLDLFWESSNPAVASVDNGMVRGLSRGEARISAIAPSGKRAEATVNVARTPAEVELVGTSFLEGRVGEELTEPVEMRIVSPRGLPVDGVLVRFSVEDGAGAVSPGEATSDGAGLVTAHWTLGTLAGPQELRVRFPDHSGTPSPVIASALPGEAVTVTVLPEEVKLRLGEAFQFKSQVSDEYGNKVTEVPVRWYTSNEDVIEIEADGWISARSSGSATVEAEPLDHAQQSSADSPGKGLGRGRGNVEVDDEEAGSEAQVTILSGNGQRGPVNTELPEELTIQVTDSRGNPVRQFDVTWSVPEGGGWVSDEVTRTDGQGRASVTMTLGPTAGENEVEAKAGGLGTAEFEATALDEDGDGTEDVASVSVAPKNAAVKVDETVQLEATARDENGFVVEDARLAWKSLDTSVATVNEGGTVLGRSVGTALIVVASVCCESADTAVVDVSSATTAEEAPGQVTDLEAVDATENSVTLQWTEVDDGTGEPAKYALRYGSPEISWGSAYDTEVSVEGTQIGAALEYTYNGLEPGSEYEFQLVAYRGTLDEDAEFGDGSNVASATTEVEDPGQVTDLEAVGVSTNSVTLQWTEVDDGTGAPAKYALRYGSPEIAWGSAYDTEVSVEGTEIGATLEYEYGGLEPGTKYEFQLVSYRGTLNVDAEFGDRSNKVSATTESLPDDEPDDNGGDSDDDGDSGGGGGSDEGDSDESDDNGGGGSGVAPAFYDGFESGDLSHTENGFRWGSVAGQPWHRDHEQNPDSPQNNVGIDAPVYRGDWALHIRNGRTASRTSTLSSEDRSYRSSGSSTGSGFRSLTRDLNLKGTYDHTPRDGPHNNKWVEFFSSRPDLLVWSEMFPNNAEDGGSRLTFNATGTHTSGSHSTATQQGVVVPNDLGRWVRFRYHVRLTTLDANTVETFYEIWRDGSYLGSDTREIPTSEENHWIDRFQILGWNNHEWPELIRWFIDEVRIYTENPGW